MEKPPALLAIPIIAFILFLAMSSNSAIAQYPEAERASPRQLQQCQDAGISPENCLNSFSPRYACNNGQQPTCESTPSFGAVTSVILNPSILPFILGAVIAFIAGIIAVKKISARSKAINHLF
jgi:hypothetical protein